MYGCDVRPVPVLSTCRHLKAMLQLMVQRIVRIHPAGWELPWQVLLIGGGQRGGDASGVDCLDLQCWPGTCRMREEAHCCWVEVDSTCTVLVAPC